MVTGPTEEPTFAKLTTNPSTQKAEDSLEQTEKPCLEKTMCFQVAF